jgi:CheY-like chemotaxis protein
MVVMYVDDDPEDQELVEETLKEIYSDVQFMSVHTADEALRVLRASASMPDYILIDINLPGMSGQAFLAELKGDQQLKEISVIGCSTSPHEGERFVRNGGGDFFVKPGSYTELVEVLKHKLHRHGK